MSEYVMLGSTNLRPQTTARVVIESTIGVILRNFFYEDGSGFEEATIVQKEGNLTFVRYINLSDFVRREAACDESQTWK
jgi:hypothetical protein